MAEAAAFNDQLAVEHGLEIHPLHYLGEGGGHIVARAREERLAGRRGDKLNPQPIVFPFGEEFVRRDCR